MFLAADEEFPQQLTAAGLTRDRRRRLRRRAGWSLFAPNGSPLDGRRPARRPRAPGDERTGVGRFAIANPEVAPYGRAAEAVLRKRGLWDAAAAASRARRHHRAGRAVCDDRQRRRRPASRTRSCSAPGFADRGTYALIPGRRPSAAAPADGAAQASGPVADTFYDYRARRRGPRPSCASTASRCQNSAPMDWTALGVSLWLGVGTIALLLPFGIWLGRLLAFRRVPRQAAGRGAGHRAARAAADGARLLPARHLRRALAARPGASQAIVGQSLPFSFRGAAARVGHRQHPVRRPADSARLRSDSRGRARRRRLLRPDAVAAVPAHRAAAGVAGHPDRRHSRPSPTRSASSASC